MRVIFPEPLIDRTKREHGLPMADRALVLEETDKMTERYDCEN
jgi:hypothetical protein